VYVGVVEPILDYRKDVAAQIDSDSREAREVERSSSRRRTRSRPSATTLKKRLAQAKTRLSARGHRHARRRALQERTNSLAQEKGISVQSTQVMKEDEADPFKKVSVRLTLSGELNRSPSSSRGRVRAAARDPFIEISRRGAVAGAKGPRTLSVTVEVSGFVQGGAAASGGAEGEPPAEGTGETPPGADGQAPGAPERLNGGRRARATAAAPRRPRCAPRREHRARPGAGESRGDTPPPNHGIHVPAHDSGGDAPLPPSRPATPGAVPPPGPPRRRLAAGGGRTAPTAPMQRSRRR
jgi:hypothetical protein